MSINDYVVKFEALHRDAKAHKMDIPDGVLAYRLLNNANLSEDKKQLIKATLTKMEYNEMKEKLKKVFTSSNVSHPSGHGIKHEPEHETLYSSDMSDTFFGNGYNYRGGRSRGRMNYRNMSSRPNNANRIPNQRSPNTKMNPVDSSGNLTRCLVCDSKYHWADKCPDRGYKL